MALVHRGPGRRRIEVLGKRDRTSAYDNVEFHRDCSDLINVRVRVWYVPCVQQLIVLEARRQHAACVSN